MKKQKRLLAAAAALALSGSLCACTGKDGNSEPAKKKADAPAEITSIKFSWWGSDSRHEATANALRAFAQECPEIKVETRYGSWSGWEDSMSAAFYAGTAPDVNQTNFSWLSQFGSGGNVFLDLDTVSDEFDFSQYESSDLDECRVNGELYGIPVSKTGRIFCWNKTAFDKAGINVPSSLEELISAGAVFKEKLGEDCYPLVLGEYDRIILMVYYLESQYGKPWIENGTLNYSAEEITKGFEFIDSLEDNHVIPTISKLYSDGAESVDNNPNWKNGSYGGIFEWDSTSIRMSDALNDGQEFVVGNYFEDMGSTHGGFSKVSLAFSISKNTQHPAECARLLNYLLNNEEGAAAMGSERGIPLSKSAFKVCTEQGLLNETVAEANSRVLSWVSFGIDPTFEDTRLKSPDGAYYESVSGLSYDEYDCGAAADILISGIEQILSEKK